MATYYYVLLSIIAIIIITMQKTGSLWAAMLSRQNSYI